MQPHLRFSNPQDVILVLSAVASADVQSSVSQLPDWNMPAYIKRRIHQQLIHKLPTPPVWLLKT